MRSENSPVSKAGELVLPSPTKANLIWRNSTLRAILQILLLIGIGGVAAWAKSVSLPLGIPGSSGVLWVTPLVIGRMAVKKRGAGILMGISTALWGVPLGLHNVLLYNSFLYGITGLALDLAAVFPFVNITNPFGAIFCGIFSHLAKFGFITEAAMLTGVTKKFIVFGLARSGLLHVAFGAAAGFIAWFAYKGVQTWKDWRHHH